MLFNDISACMQELRWGVTCLPAILTHIIGIFYALRQHPLLHSSHFSFVSVHWSPFSLYPISASSRLEAPTHRAARRIHARLHCLLITLCIINSQVALPSQRGCLT